MAAAPLREPAQRTGCRWEAGGGVKAIVNQPKGEPGLISIETLPPAPGAGPVFAPLDGVAVVAEDTWTAIRIARGLEIEWTDSPNRSFDSEALRRSLREAVMKPERRCRDPERAMSMRPSPRAARKFPQFTKW